MGGKGSYGGRRRMSVVCQRVVNDVILRQAYQDCSLGVDLRAGATGCRPELCFISGRALGAYAL